MKASEYERQTKHEILKKTKYLTFSFLEILFICFKSLIQSDMKLNLKLKPMRRQKSNSEVYELKISAMCWMVRGF